MLYIPSLIKSIFRSDNLFMSEQQEVTFRTISQDAFFQVLNSIHHPRICVWYYAKTDVFVFIFILVANDTKAYLTPGYCIIIFSSVLFQVLLYIIIYCDLKFVIVFFIFFLHILK